jgi:uncharacterized phosphosugar-binding protein
MSKLTNEYIENVITLMKKIETEEEKAIDDASQLMADAIQSGNRLFGFGCSHSSLPIQDVVYRAGGLMLMNPIYAPGIASLDVHPNTMTSGIEKLVGYAKVILDNQPIQKGDVLIIVSVSGRNAVPIEMAQIAREKGVKVIGVTSLKYSQGVESRHPSGKKMFDFADVVIDNKVDKGDAMLSMKGLETKFTPASGITSAAIMHCLTTATIEKLLERGITPPVFIAANVDGGAEHNLKLLAEYKDRIFYV